MKPISTLLICLVCCLCVICACGKEGVDTTAADTGTDTAAPSQDAETKDNSDSDYPFATPGAYVPTETDEPNIFIDIAPNDTEDKWGKMNINSE